MDLTFHLQKMKKQLLKTYICCFLNFQSHGKDYINSEVTEKNHDTAAKRGSSHT